MPHLDPYESWKERRARLGPPADFAERVMTEMHPRGPARQQGTGLGLAGAPALGWAVGRVAIWSLACAACLFRILQLAAPFLVAQSSP